MHGWVTALLLIGAIQSNSDAVRAIADDTEEAPRAIRYLRSKGKPGLWALYGAAKKADGPARVNLLTAMGKLPVSGAEWSLKEAFKVGDPDSQLGAVQGLLLLDDSPGVRKVLLEAAQSPSPEVQQAAARGLAQRLEKVRPEVERMLLEPDLPQRSTAIRVARLTEDPALVREAVDVGLSDNRPEIEVEVLKLIGTMNASAMADAVETRLRRAENPRVQQAALDALLLMTTADPLTRLQRVLADPSVDADTRIRVYQSLRRGDLAAFQAMVDALARAPDGESFLVARLREGAVTEDEKRRWVRTLISPRAPVRSLAETALRALGSDVHGMLVQQLASSDALMRTRAMAFLVTHADDALRSALERAYRSDDPAERAGAVTALIQMAAGTDEVPQYLESLNDPDNGVRVAAARGLGATAHPTSDAALSERLPELEAAVARAALEAAATREPPALARKWAKSMLASDDTDLRLSALGVLTPAPDADSVARLEAFLRRARPAEKVLAVRAIALSDQAEAATLLVRLVTDPDPEVRKAALTYVEGS